jgi:predicted 3-demethylubiquinone-9 3-methyltransferase (glyoxalase superfamily)
MQLSGKRIAACLWFDTQAEQAAEFYVSVFENSRLGRISRYGKAGQNHHQKTPGSVMTVEFELDGQKFTALNAGPHFKFNEAVSFQIMCETQGEIDSYWKKLTAGGEEGPCGWLKDKFGLSWQVVPSAIPKMVADADPAKAGRVVEAIMTMKKLDVATLERAYAGEPA